MPSPDRAEPVADAEQPSAPSTHLNIEETVITAQVTVCSTFMPDETDEESVENSTGRQDKRWFIAICVTLMSIALVVALVLSTDSRASDNASHNSATQPPPMDTNFDPDQLQSRFEQIQAMVSIYSDPTDFLRPESPQSQALQFLVYRDRTIADLSISTEPQLRQRFVVLVFLYTFTSILGGQFALDPTTQESLSECNMPDIFKCNDDGQLVDVKLSNQLMSGQVPNELRHLTMLTTLDLSHNFLEGTIPDVAWKALTNLGKFYSISSRVYCTLD